jgi:Na+/H+ antiporter NhaD/arsenite permease-like protein
MLKISIIGIALIVIIVVLYLARKSIRKAMEANAELRRKINKAVSVVFILIAVICFISGSYFVVQAFFFTKSPFLFVKTIVALPGVFIVVLGIVCIFLEKKRRKEVKI